MKLSALLQAACIALCLAAGTASALERPFPPLAKRGTMSLAQHPAIVIDGKQRTLAPGARIWNINNTIDMPGTIPGGEYIVNYTEDAMGAIDRVWLLTNAEAAQPAPSKAAK